MTRVTYVNTSYQCVNQQIDKGRTHKRRHRVEGLPVVKEVRAEQNSHNDNSEPELAVEILLNVEVLMPAGNAMGHFFPLRQSCLNPNLLLCFAGRADDRLDRLGRDCDFCLTASAFELYNETHETLDSNDVDRGFG